MCGVYVGGTFTSGFPSLDEIQGNGSLLSDGVYSTHDGEIRSVPVRSNCTNVTMTFTDIYRTLCLSLQDSHKVPVCKECIYIHVCVSTAQYIRIQTSTCRAQTLSL